MARIELDKDEQMMDRLAVSMNMTLEQGKEVEGKTFQMVNVDTGKIEEVRANTPEDVRQKAIENGYAI